MSEGFTALSEMSNSARMSFIHLHPELLSIDPQIKIKQATNNLIKSYEDIIAFLGEWVDLPEDTKKVMAIWIIGTYFHKEFSTYPFLFFNAMRGSGKTRTLKIISHLQKDGNGDVLTNPSESIIFRTAKDRGLIIDEFESEKSKDKQTMREVLNSAYKEGGKVFRNEKHKVDGKEVMVAVGHNVYTPVAMANISGIDDVLGDRSITFILEKSMNPALVKKIEDFQTNKVLQHIKANLSASSVELCSVHPLQKAIYGWNAYVTNKYTPIHTMYMYTETLHEERVREEEEREEIMNDFYNLIDETGIFGRNLELFFPLLILSKMLHQTIFEDILKIVKNLNFNKKDDDFIESKDISLIEFISNCDRHRFDYKFVHELHREFKEFIGNAGDEEKERWNTVTWFGLALKRLKLYSDRKRVAKGYLVLLAVDKAKEKLNIFKKEETK